MEASAGELPGKSAETGPLPADVAAGLSRRVSRLEVTAMRAAWRVVVVAATVGAVVGALVISAPRVVSAIRRVIT